MQCPRCGHNNISSFRFCEVCLQPLKGSVDGAADDVVGKFFDDADLLEAGQTDASRGSANVARFDLPWKQGDKSADTQGSKQEVERIALSGRDREIATIVDAVKNGIHSKKLAAFAVHGEDGSGRSSVVVAVRERLDRELPGARFLVSSGQGAHRPFSLIERLLRLRFDIPDYLGGTIAGERFERSVEAFYGDPAGAEVARTCGPMLGFRFWQEHDIDFEDQAEQARRAREALYNLLARDLAAPQTVVILDDAGDGDAESLDFISQLHKDNLEAQTVLVVAVDRRGLVRRPWLGELPHVELDALSDEVMTAIANHALKGVQDVRPEDLTVLINHASGRPGTLLDEIEQLAKNEAISLVDGTWRLHAEKLAELASRGGLVSGRGSRLGGLTDLQLQILSMGAVFGTRFWLGGVVAMLRREGSDGVRNVSELDKDSTPERVRKACHALAERSILVPERQGPLPHETAYRLVEESDRESLMELHQPADLQQLSLCAAVWLQMVARQRSSELAEVLAPLWLTAGDPVHAAHLYLSAGEQAAEEFRNPDAKMLLEKARSLVPATYAHVQWAAAIGLGRLYEHDGHWADAERSYRDALETAWRFRARGRGAEALLRLGRLFRLQGKAQPALEQLAAALKLFEAVGDYRGLASTCDDVGRTYWTSGRTKAALGFLKKAAQYRERMGDRTNLGYTLANLGLVSLSLGHLEQARGYLEKAVQMQRDRKNLVGLFEALSAQGMVHVASGAIDAAVACMEEASDTARRVGNRRMQALVQNNLGEVLLLAGRLEDGEALLYKAVEGSGRLGDHAILADAARNLSVAARQRNDHDRALKWARRSVAAAQSCDVVRTRAASHRNLGDILADGGEIEAAADAYTRAADSLQQAGETHELQACLQAHAALFMRVGRKEQAQALLDRCDTLASQVSPAKFLGDQE